VLERGSRSIGLDSLDWRPALPEMVTARALAPGRAAPCCQISSWEWPVTLPASRRRASGNRWASAAASV